MVTVARIRSIKPQFWLDEDLATLAPFARLLYIGLWNHADDRGVFQYRPRRLKAQIFPYDDLSEEAMIVFLDGLESLGKFTRFEVEGEEFGFLVNFSKHQKINRPSKYGFVDAALIPQYSNSETPIALTESSVNPPAPLSLGSREQGVGSREEETDPALAAAAQAYENNIGLLTGAIGERLAELVDEYPDGWVVDAIKRATELEKRSLAYGIGILKGWHRDGRGREDRRVPGDRSDAGQHQGQDRETEDDEFAAIRL